MHHLPMNFEDQYIFLGSSKLEKFKQGARLNWLQHKVGFQRDHIEVLYRCILRAFPQDFQISYTGCRLISNTVRASPIMRYPSTPTDNSGPLPKKVAPMVSPLSLLSLRATPNMPGSRYILCDIEGDNFNTPNPNIEGPTSATSAPGLDGGTSKRQTIGAFHSPQWRAPLRGLAKRPWRGRLLVHDWGCPNVNPTMSLPL